MNAPHGLQQIKLHGRTVTYRREGSGPVIVLIHGLAGSLHTWDAVTTALASNYTVIAPDLAGHGGSDGPAGDYSLGAYASGLRDMLNALGHDRATIVGHSLGGGVAMQFAYQFPQYCERIVLVSSGGLGDEVSLALRAAALPAAELVLPLIAHRHLITAGARIGRWVRALGVSPSENLLESLRTYATLSDPRARRSFVQTVRAVIDYRGQRVSATDLLPTIANKPSLIMWGTEDRIIPVAHALNAQRLLPGGQLALFDGAGHFPHLADPARFVQTLTTFIEGTEIDQRKSTECGPQSLATTSP